MNGQGKLLTHFLKNADKLVIPVDVYKRQVLFCDELGTMPAFDILPLFSAGRSRKLTLVPIIQSLAQLEKNYGKEGAEIIQENVQDTICGGFAPKDVYKRQAVGRRTEQAAEGRNIGGASGGCGG